MFTKLSPQQVRHSGGYVITVANREAVEYAEEHRHAEVSVDFGRTVGVYAGTLTGWITPLGRTPMSSTERAEVLRRIVAGLEAMGSTVELC